MNNMGGLIFGMIAGAVGAAVWAAIAYFGNLEIGYIAWGIGALIGFAVSFGSRQKGMLPAMIAVIITIASLCAGKYATVALAVSKEVNSIEVSNSDAVSHMAFTIAEEKEAGGENVAWKNGANYETAESIVDLPDDIQDHARSTWSKFSEEEKSAFKKQMVQEWANAMGHFKNQFTINAFFASFSMYDLLFFGLGIFTAAKIAHADVIDEGAIESVDDDELDQEEN